MSRAQEFADALQRLEQDRDLDPFLTQFSDDVRLVRPETGGHEHAARQFWQAYLDQFDDIASTFARLVDGDRLSELEWTSTGHLRTGRKILYTGVSLLEQDADGKVQRFATYYDTAAFTSP